MSRFLYIVMITFTILFFILLIAFGWTATQWRVADLMSELSKTSKKHKEAKKSLERMGQKRSEGVTVMDTSMQRAIQRDKSFNQNLIREGQKKREQMGYMPEEEDDDWAIPVNTQNDELASRLTTTGNIGGRLTTARQSNMYPTEPPTGYMDNYQEEQPTGYIDNYQEEQPTGYIEDYTTEQPTGYIEDYTTEQPTGYIEDYTTEQPTGYIADYATEQPTGYIAEDSAEQPTGYMGDYVVEQPTGYISNVQTQLDIDMQLVADAESDIMEQTRGMTPKNAYIYRGKVWLDVQKKMGNRNISVLEQVGTEGVLK